MTQKIYTETLPVSTAKLLEQVAEKRPDFLLSFYLSGGTALSLLLGHRESEDLDFFSEQSFQPERIEQQLLSFGKLSDTELTKGTLNTYLAGVKLQFLEYPYRLLEPLVQWKGIKLSSVLDIACTKLQTVGMRGSKKDFIDLYFLLQQFTLPDLLIHTKKKYAESNYSEPHILKSLVYFDDAQSQPMPRMHIDISWEKIKASLISKVKSVPVV
jgi:Nucleotidyl transferase AbiEii toxin, Type IV TA system